MARSRQLRVEVIGDTSSLERAFGRTSASTSRFTNTMDRLGSAARRGMQVAGLAAVAWAGYSVKAAADVGESINKASVIFEENRKQVLEWSKTTANAFGVSRSQALESAASFGAMLDTAGVAGDAMADMSVKLVELAADMGSFNNQDPSEMLDRLRSGLAGEAEPLRRFGVFLSEAAIQTQAVSDGIAEQGEELTEAQKIQARYNLILEQTVRQQGDFGRTANSMPNQIRRLQASFADISAEIGQKLLPVAVKVLEWANKNLPAAIEFVSDVMRGWIRLWNFLGKVVGNVIAAILNGLQEFLRVWITVAGGIVDAAALAFGWVPGIGGKIRRFQERFHEMSQAVLEDLEDQIDRFENWGEKSAYELAKTSRMARGVVSAVSSIAQAVKTLSGAVVPGIPFVNPSGPGLGDGLGIVPSGGGTPTQMFSSLAAAIPGPQSISSGYRPGAITSSGNPSLHGVAPPWNAVDVVGDNLLPFAQAAAAAYGSRLRELIYTPLGFSIKNGQRVGPIAASDHYDHVHLADNGGVFVNRSNKVGLVGIGPNVSEAVTFHGAQKIGEVGGGTHVTILKLDGRTIYQTNKRESLVQEITLGGRN